MAKVERNEIPPRGKIKNLAASIKARLLNYSKENRIEYQGVFRLYVQERFLYRVSRSAYSKKFILKGALLFLAFNISKYRPTKDIDFLGTSVENDAEVLKKIIKEILLIDFEDGLTFDPESIEAEEIVETQEYHGIRIKFNVFLKKARDRIQIDIGFGDPIYEGPVEIDYPVLLDLPSPKLLAYSIESAIAEKFEAIVSRGFATSRMKDFFDILHFAEKRKFESGKLKEAIKITFNNRNTDLNNRYAVFSSDFKKDKVKQSMWTTFLNQRKLKSESEFEKVIERLELFVEPIFQLNENKIWNPENWSWE